jgi:MFS family permease
MHQLVAFRLLQGLGAGGVLPTTQTILGDVYRLPERARLTGLFSSIWGISALLGPAIGGFLTEHVSWRWVFYVNLPLCVLSIVLVSSFLHERVARRRHAIDYLGAASLAGAVGLFLVALQNPGGSLAESGALYVLAGLLALAFVWQERRAPEPLVPLGIFRRRIIGLSVLISGLIGLVLYAQNAFVPPFVQGAMGYSPTMAGFVLAAVSLSWPIGSTLGGRALLRWGYRAPCVLGCAMLAAGFVALGLLPPSVGLAVPFAIEFLLGPGFGLTLNLTTISIQDAVGWEQRGVVTSLNQFSRNIGGILGVSVAGTIFSAGVATVSARGIDPNQLLSPNGPTVPAADLGFVEGALAGSLHGVFFLIAAAATLGGIAAVLLPHGRPGAPRPAAPSATASWAAVGVPEGRSPFRHATARSSQGALQPPA